MGAHYILKMRAAMINGDLSEKQKYEPVRSDINQEQHEMFALQLPLLTAA